MSICFIILSLVLLIAGIVGCVIPVIPGPFVAYLGLLALIPASSAPSTAALVFFGLLTAVVTVLDYVVPALGAKRFNCSRWGTIGCLLGTLIGVFFLPVGLLFPFVGAFLGELIARKPVRAAALGALGAFLGFLSGVLIKAIACLAMLTYCLYVSFFG